MSAENKIVEIKLDFVFIQDGSPYRLREHEEGVYWLHILHVSKQWVSTRKVKSSPELWAMQNACLPWSQHHLYEFGVPFMKEGWPSADAYEPEGSSAETITDPKILAIVEAASRFVELGDEGVFMTSESCGSESIYRVVLKCKDIHHLQSVHQSIIDLVKAVRNLDEPPIIGRSSGLTDKEMESVGNAFDAVRKDNLEWPYL